MTPTDATLTDAEIAAFRELLTKLELDSDVRNIADRLASECQKMRQLVHDKNWELAENSSELAAVTKDSDDFERRVNNAVLSICDQLGKPLTKENWPHLLGASDAAVDVEMIGGWLIQQLATANSRIEEFEKHYAREAYTNELADLRTMEQNWKERNDALTAKVKELEAELVKWKDEGQYY